MRIRAFPVAIFLVIAACPAVSRPAPRHDVCGDLGPSPVVGISSFSAAGDWLIDAHETGGVGWRMVYVYLLPTEDVAGYQWFIGHKAEVARSVGADPVYTFYQLLSIGQNAGLSGSEPEIVRAVLESDSLMSAYFDNFILVLQTVAAIAPPVFVHVEPDSWGFMMWAMGVEGNDDPTSVPVRVGGSGHPDVAGLPDHAAGLGQALVALRDMYAPEVRLGWHASNFRVGTRPEVVLSFFSQMADWDFLVGENPHMEPDETRWWEPWDETMVSANLAWFETMTAGTGLPIILWQLPIGTTDWHLLGTPGDVTMLRRFAEAGVAGLLFEHLGEGSDPGAFRASGDLGTVPSPESGAGGTAADMRERLAAYTASPLAWPEGSPCFSGGSDVDAPDGPDRPDEALPPDAETAPDTAGDGGADAQDDAGGQEEGSGCGCAVVAA